MLNKELIKTRFKRSIKTYDENAFVQKTMADELIFLLGEKKFKNILEIGSYTGILTERLVKKNPDFISYTALDIISNSGEYIKRIDDRISFLNVDIEEFTTEKKFDLIIANASLQWCADFEKVVKKLRNFLEINGTVALSVFAKDNFFEIKDIFDVGLNYLSIDEIGKIFQNRAEIIEKEYELKFDDIFDVLRHLKATGVNAITNKSFSICKLKDKLKIYKQKYGNKLTYKPLYIIYPHP